MSAREQYPAGVPCWVDTLQPDPQAALEFYAPLFGWEIAGPGSMPGNPPEMGYYVAQRGGRDIAGIGAAPDETVPAAWNTYIRVDDADAIVARVVKAGGSVYLAPFDVLPAGRMAVLSDPTGAAFCIWEARTREGAQTINEPCAWAMSALNTTDPDRAIAFYGAVFGWQAEAYAGTPVTLWRLPGYVGGEPQQPVPRDVVAVMLPLAAGPVPSYWGVDFWIADTDAAVAHVTKLGGTIVVPAYDTPLFRSAVIADPQGATFSISQLTAAL